MKLFGRRRERHDPPVAGVTAKPILIMGMSHTIALSKGLSDTHKQQVNIFHMGPGGFRCLLSGQIVSGRTFERQVFKALRPIRIFSMVGGNKYNTFGILENPVRFDFAHPTIPYLDDERTIVPYDMIFQTLESRMKKQLAFAPRWKALFRLPISHVLPPPPVANNNYIAQKPGPFKNLIHLGPAPPELRMKLYDVHSAVIRKSCAAHAFDVLPAPPSTQDANGFLAPGFVGDVTHGNARYGAAVLDQIVDRANA